MSFIACTSACVYQQDGYCQLQRAVSCGQPGETEHCVHFLPRRNSAVQAAESDARH